MWHCMQTLSHGLISFLIITSTSIASAVPYASDTGSDARLALTQRGIPQPVADVSLDLEKRRGGGGGHGGSSGGGGRGKGGGSSGGKGGHEGGDSGATKGLGGKTEGGGGPGGLRNGASDVRGSTSHSSFGYARTAGLGTGLLLALVIVDTAYVGVMLAAVGFDLYNLWEYYPEFSNSDINKWPSYDPPGIKDNGVSVTALWSIRTFSDDTCGSNGNNPYNDHKSVPVMMTEYISSDLHYGDDTLCESFMIEKSHTIKSAAIWISDQVPHPGIVTLYSNPTCAVTTNADTKGDSAPNGMIPSSWSDNTQDYIQIYNGSAVLHDQPDYGASNPKPLPGKWGCLQGDWRSLNVAFQSITTYNNIDPNAAITKEMTVPKPGRGANDVGKIRNNHPVMTTDIGQTYQKVST